MGFATQTAKTTKANLSLLRGKTFFRELATTRAVRRSSKIDGNSLKRKVIILARRKLNHRLRIALVISLMYMIIVFGIAFSIDI